PLREAPSPRGGVFGLLGLQSPAYPPRGGDAGVHGAAVLPRIGVAVGGHRRGRGGDPRAAQAGPREGGSGIGLEAGAAREASGSRAGGDPSRAPPAAPRKAGAGVRQRVGVPDEGGYLARMG